MAHRKIINTTGQDLKEPMPEITHGRSLRHIAIIMDGNGRWASTRGLPRIAGHQAGVKAVRRCLEAAIERKVEWLTLYTFSSENWCRSPQEVSDLTGLLRHYIRHELRELNKQGVRLYIIGDLRRFDLDLQEELRYAENITQNNTGLNLVLALSYGGRGDILQAVAKLSEEMVEGRCCAEDLTEGLFSSFLLTAGCPDPDLIIRTSGEYRLSNFLLWQSAYAELVFQDIYWPDYDAAHFFAAIETFHRRSRRFGGRPVAVERV